MSTLRIAETFFSIQGEGALTGVPSFFVRTTGCNLRCGWCDTPYTSWTPRGEDRSVDDILAELADRPAVRHVVLTGGEPLIAPAVPLLTKAIVDAGHHLTIETAATVLPEGVHASLYSMSPKLSGSTPDDPKWARLHDERRLNLDVIRAMMAAGEHQLKFVIGAPPELDEVAAVVDAVSADPARVMLMPEGTTPERLDEVAAWLVDACFERGWRFCDRLHIRLFGNTEGT